MVILKMIYFKTSRMFSSYTVFARVISKIFNLKKKNVQLTMTFFSKLITMFLSKNTRFVHVFKRTRLLQQS